MSLEAIRKSIIEEAEAKAKAERQAAEAEAAKILKEAKDRADSLLKEAEEEARREAERMRMEAEAGLETERNSAILESKGRVIEEALKHVRKEVEDRIRSEGMGKILNAALKQFSEVYQGSDFVIKTNKKNVALVKDKGTVEAGDVDGFVLSTPDGRIALNATVASIVDNRIDGIRKMVANELFPKAIENRMEKAAAKSVARPRKGGRSRPSKALKKQKPRG
ncbi:MAG: V-type ATP synthase subunit E [Candidatus Micrarchaeaceae archaeon]